MRHKVDGRNFGRTANQRKALFRNLIASLILHERIETTVSKAKEVRHMVEEMVTYGKRGDVHSKRLALAKVPDRNIMSKLFDDIAPRFANRNGGYLRIVRTRNRIKDQTEMAVIEFVDYEERLKLSGKDKAKEK
jgi:large subunit ribosomal protein L17